jgi:hypothetical protein
MSDKAIEGSLSSSVCYHYTSRLAAQNIISMRKLRPGDSGLIWLTPDIYGTGATAANRLAIINKAVEVCLIIPTSLIADADRVTRVAPILDDQGIVRDGMGLQFTISDELDVSACDWKVLEAP